IGKMDGDRWQKFANLRLLVANQWFQPGKKLLFMGGDIAQWREWNHDAALDWELLGEDSHRGVLRLVADLNRLMRDEPALHACDFEPRGFEWLDANDSEHSVVSFIRRGVRAEDVLVAVFNYTPVPRHNYRVGAPSGGWWREVLNTDAARSE